MMKNTFHRIGVVILCTCALVALVLQANRNGSRPLSCFERRATHDAAIDGRNQHRTIECGAKPSLIVFALYGVLERARNCHTSVNEMNVFRAATFNYTIPHVRIGFGMDMNGQRVDKVHISRSETNKHIAALNLSQLSFVKVATIDAAVDSVYCKAEDVCLRELCKRPFWRYDYGKVKIRHAMRAMYCEYGIANMLREQFDTDAHARIVVVALSADVMLNKPLQEADIIHAACSHDEVFLTQNNDGLGGYTDGFYVGHIDAMKAVLSTFERLPLHFDSTLRERDYESLIKATCDRSNITRVVLRGFGNFLKDFVKIRTTGQIFGKLPCGLKNHIDFEGCPQLQNSECSADA